VAEEGLSDRRPIGARKAGWSKQIASILAAAGVTPNQISIFGVIASGLCAACLCLSPHSHGAIRVMLLLIAAGTVPLRAACNMLDGMVAVEFGKRTKSGIVFNELPDRVSDALILVGAGYASSLAWAPTLGWLAALLAVTTAYVRVLGGLAGGGQDFSGVMAKQQRMAVMTIAILISLFDPLWGGHYGYPIVGGLALVVAGCAITILQRTRRLLWRLEGR
jgi:phosphatidylglycerophosphate synthase